VVGRAGALHSAHLTFALQLTNALIELRMHYTTIALHNDWCVNQLQWRVRSSRADTDLPPTATTEKVGITIVRGEWRRNSGATASGAPHACTRGVERPGAFFWTRV
jgi:hypothetical protein